MKYKKLIRKYSESLDELMLLNEIKESLVNRLFNDEKIQLFIESALAIADALYHEYSDVDINKIIIDKGYEIKSGEINKYYFSRLDNKTKVITTTNKYDELEECVPEITKKKLKQLSIAHEFVHVLELNGELKIDDHNLLYLNKPLLFGLSKTTYTSMIYELVAHQFAKLKTGISFNPKMLDYISQIESGKTTFAKLEERLERSKDYYGKIKKK